MTIVLLFIHTLLLPLFVLLFVGLGLAASITSAMIEANVFSMILAGGNHPENTTLMAWVIVGGFESFKLLTVYLGTVNRRVPHRFQMGWTLRIAKPFFSLISLVATLAFTCNSLYASLATTSLLDSIQQEISTLSDQAVMIEAEHYSADSDPRLEPYQKELDMAIAMAESHQDVWNASSYMDSVSTARARLSEATTAFESDFNEQKQEKIDSIHQEIAELENQKDLKNSDTLHSANNMFLDRVLSLMWQFLAQTDYPQAAYWCTAVVLSLILGIGIELVISGTFAFLAQPQHQLQEAFHVSTETPKAYSWIVRLLLQFACGLSLMLLVALVLKYTSSSVSLNWGASSLALLAGLPLVNLFFERNTEPFENLSAHISGIRQALLGFKESSKRIGITSAVLLVLYFLIGALTRSVDPSDMSIPQVAALLAGAVGSNAFTSIYS